MCMHTHVHVCLKMWFIIFSYSERSCGPKTFGTLAFVAEVLAKDSWHYLPVSFQNPSAAVHICRAAHLWAGRRNTTFSRLHLLVWPHKVVPWLYHKANFTWLTNRIKHTIKLRSSELKLGPNPYHLAWEIECNQPHFLSLVCVLI